MTKSYIKASDERPNDQDVLFGRGNLVKFHPGNFRFRKLVNKYRSAWRSAKEERTPGDKKKERSRIERNIIDEIANADPPGKFVKFDESDRVWKEVPFAQALKKTQKALREGQWLEEQEWYEEEQDVKKEQNKLQLDEVCDFILYVL